MNLLIRPAGLNVENTVFTTTTNTEKPIESKILHVNFWGGNFFFKKFFKNMHENTSLKRSNLVHVDHVLDPPSPLVD